MEYTQIENWADGIENENAKFTQTEFTRFMEKKDIIKIVAEKTFYNNVSYEKP
ncbi:hypothetical protein ACFQZJ_18980 [Maribacter chungangensis]|uniref:Uncharacterized protein n=1 Tax=Maribacter chungangensis TaxID=1069117 RepID=A0ABW3B886_9FLAO